MNYQVMRFLEELFAANELNCLPESYGGGRIFDAPLMGGSGGDDYIFEKFKEVVAPEHLTPVEMSFLRRRLRVLPVRHALHR